MNDVLWSLDAGGGGEGDKDAAVVAAMDVMTGRSKVSVTKRLYSSLISTESPMTVGRKSMLFSANRVKESRVFG